MMLYSQENYIDDIKNNNFENINNINENNYLKNINIKKSNELVCTDKHINICYIGAGYVGGTSGSVMAYKCPKEIIKVTICDIFEEKIKKWNSNKVFINLN